MRLPVKGHAFFRPWLGASAILVATVVSCVSIVDALNELRRYVFTSGGIGPTHGDITADCVAKAFGVPIDTDPRALAYWTADAIKNRYLKDPRPLVPA